MLKVFFTCFWQSNFLVELKKITPECKGIWKNIEGINNLNECDYIIVLDDLDENLLKMGEKYFKHIMKTPNKLIFFQRENTYFINQRPKSWFIKNILPYVNKNYSYENNFFYTFSTPNFLDKTYDELKSMHYSSNSKKISCIVSTKNCHANYTKRINFIKNYSSKYPNTIDIFGKGWNKNILGNNFKGELGNYHRHDKNKNLSKFDGLHPYGYSIVLENFPKDKGKVSEKITDTLLCWCMPIYWGSKYTGQYYPKEAFHLIDLDDPNVYEKVYKISQTPLVQKNIDAIKEARNLILDKYNIWEHIYQILNNKDNYVTIYTLK